MYNNTHGNNLIRLWHAENSKGGNGLITPTVYQRSTVSGNLDGLNKFDLTLFNIGDLTNPNLSSSAYFERLRARVIEAASHNQYVSVMLFNAFNWEHDGRYLGNRAWDYNPFHPSNNINGVNGDSNSDGTGTEMQTPSVIINNYQKAYVAQVIDTLNDLDNVIWEVCNECLPSSSPWQYDLINFIRTYENGKSKRHPIMMSTNSDFSQTSLTNSSADIIVIGGITDSNPVMYPNRVVMHDTDHSRPCELFSSSLPWKMFTRGQGVMYFDCPWTSGQSNDNVIADRIGQTIAWSKIINLKTMKANQSCSSTYCLSSTTEHLLFLPTGGSVSVNLTGSNYYNVTWFNTVTGVSQSAAQVTPGNTTLNSPFGTAEAVVHVKNSGTAVPATPARTLTPLLKAFPSSVTITAPQGTNGYGSFELQKSSTTQSSYYISTNRGWIWLNPPYGSTQTITTEVDLIEINAQTAGLPVGTHTGGVVWIVESGPQGNQTLTIPVTYNVTAPGSTPPPPPSPTIGLSLTTLGFNIQENGSSLSQNVSLSNTVAGSTLNWAISHNASWLSISPILGTNNATFVVTANPTGLVPGTYNAVITVSGDGATNSPQTINVTLTVTAVPPATLTLKQALQNAIDQCQALTTCTGKDFSDKLEPLLNQVP
jgi:hypothetical protein